MIVSHRHKFIFFKPMKSAGSSVEVAILPHCGKEDVSTGTGYLEELQSSEYNYYTQNNTKIFKILRGREAQDYCKDHDLNVDFDKYKQIALSESRYVPHMTYRMLQNDSDDLLDETRGYYKVSIIRNPYEALVSFFWWAFYEPDILNDVRNPEEKYTPTSLPHIAPLEKDPPHVLKEKFKLFLESKATFKTPIRKQKPNATIFEWFCDWQNEFYENMDYLMRFDDLQNEYENFCKKVKIEPQVLPRLKTTQRKSSLIYKDYYDDVTKEIVKKGFHQINDAYNFKI